MDREFLGIRCRLIELAAALDRDRAATTATRPATRGWRKSSAVSKSSPTASPIAPSACKWYSHCPTKRTGGPD